MMSDQPPSNLEELLDQIGQTAENGGRVTFDEILEVVGRRSFGPLLLLAGLITVMPVVGDIPGVPTVMGVFVVLIAGQMLLHRDHLWLPKWLLNRSVKREKLRSSLEWMRRPAEFVDGWLKPRLARFTHKTAAHVIAGTCLIIGLALPPMEVVPFSANFAGAALTAFGLSLIAHDGLLSLIAFGFTALTFGIVAYNFV